MRGNNEASPTPEAIRAAREKAGLSRKEAAALIGKSVRSYEKWEGGGRQMDPAFWTLFSMKLKERRRRK